MRTDRNTNCLLRCCSYCAAVPCPTFCAFLLLIISLSSCCGALLVGAFRTREVVNQPNALPLLLPITLGSFFGMVLVAVLVLFVATVSSRSLGHKLLSNTISITLVRITNFVTIALLVLLQCCWVLVSVALGAIVLLLQHIDLVQQNDGCVRFINYGLPLNWSWYCYDGLKAFYLIIQSHDLFLCYSISFISAIVVVMALTFLTICTTINVIRLERLGSRKKNSTNGRSATKPTRSTNIDDEITPAEL